MALSSQPEADTSRPHLTRPSSIKEADFVQSLARGLLVVRSFDADHPRQTLSEVAARTGLTRATARRLLLTLTDLGYTTMNGREFSLGPGVLSLGYAYLSTLSVRAIAQPFLDILSEQVDESTSMSVLDGTDVVYVARVPTKRIFSVDLDIGSRLPAYATSMGRVLLGGMDEEEVDEILAESDLAPLTDKTITDPARLKAEFAKAHQQGWYVLDEELELGLRSIAAPVAGRDGRPVAAVNVSTAVARTSMDELESSIVPKLLDASRSISQALRSR